MLNWNSEIHYTDEIKHKGRRVVFFGEMGCWKTTTAASAPKPFFIDADDGTIVLEKLHVPFVNVPFGMREDPLNFTMRYLRWFKDGKGPFEKEYADCQTIVLDTISSLFEKLYLARAESEGAAVERKKLSGFNPIWTELQACGYNLFQIAEKISYTKNVIFVAHTYDVTDANLSKLATVPQLIGSSKDNILKHFHDVLYFRRRGKEVIASPYGHGLALGKVRTQSLKDKVEIPNPTWEKIYGK